LPIQMRRFILVSALLTIGSGCGSTPPPLIGDNDSGVPPTIVKTGTCTVEGETAPCQVVTGVNNGIVNCYHGTQTCTNGQWGYCGDTSDAASD
jgi:hypothetical protein